MTRLALTTDNPDNVYLVDNGGQPRLFEPEPFEAPPIPPLGPAFFQGDIFIDPQNTTGKATSTPIPWPQPTPTGWLVRHYRDIVAAWGTLQPLCDDPTAGSHNGTSLIFLSSHVDQTDPVLWRPISNNGADTNILSQLAAGPTFTLGAVTPKNTAAGTNSALAAVVAGGAVGQLLVNETHPSTSFVVHAQEGGSFILTQPIVPRTLDDGTIPVEVDTWATGNHVHVQPLAAIYLVEFAPIYGSFDLPGTANVFHVAPAGITNIGEIRIDASAGAFMLIQESWLNGQFDSTSVAAPFFASAVHMGNLYGPVGAPGTFVLFGGVNQFWAGGFVFGNSVQFINNSGVLDADIVLDAPSFDGSSMEIGTAYCNGVVIVVGGTTLVVTALSFGAKFYGSAAANIALLGTGLLRLGSGSYAAAFTAADPIAHGFFMNGLQTANSFSAGTINPGITTTPAHLDAAAGVAGFGGVAWQFGGSSISNRAA